MQRLRRFLWQNLGITLTPRLYILTGIVCLAVLAVVLAIFVPALMQNRYIRIVFVLIGAAGLTILLGSSYTALNWAFSSKEERRQIETEVSLKQLRRHVEYELDASDRVAEDDR